MKRGYIVTGGDTATGSSQLWLGVHSERYEHQGNSESASIERVHSLFTSVY
jgi:hypothetical protein